MTDSADRADRIHEVRHRQWLRTHAPSENPVAVLFGGIDRWIFRRRFRRALMVMASHIDLDLPAPFVKERLRVEGIQRRFDRAEHKHRSFRQTPQERAFISMSEYLCQMHAYDTVDEEWLRNAYARLASYGIATGRLSRKRFPDLESPDSIDRFLISAREVKERHIEAEEGGYAFELYWRRTGESVIRLATLAAAEEEASEWNRYPPPSGPEVGVREWKGPPWIPRETSPPPPSSSRP